MKNKLSRIGISVVSIGLLMSCGSITEKMEEKINELNHKTERLDSLLNKEFDKVMALDSLVNMEGVKIKKLDSLINKLPTRIDSMANEKRNTLKKLVE